MGGAGGTAELATHLLDGGAAAQDQLKHEAPQVAGGAGQEHSRVVEGCRRLQKATCTGLARQHRCCRNEAMEQRARPLSTRSCCRLSQGPRTTGVDVELLPV